IHYSSSGSKVCPGAGDLNKLGDSKFAGRGAGRCSDVRQLVEELSESRQSVLYGRYLHFTQGNFLPHPLEVGLSFEQLSARGALGDVETAFRTGHPMRTLVKEVVAAKSMAQVVVLPGRSRRGPV